LECQSFEIYKKKFEQGRNKGVAPAAFFAGRTNLGTPKSGKSGKFSQGAAVYGVQNSINLNQKMKFFVTSLCSADFIKTYLNFV